MPVRRNIGIVPSERCICYVDRSSVYRFGPPKVIHGWHGSVAVASPPTHCESPKVNKGNSDAACHKMRNVDLIERLKRI